MRSRSRSVSSPFSRRACSVAGDGRRRWCDVARQSVDTDSPDATETAGSTAAESWVQQAIEFWLGTVMKKEADIEPSGLEVVHQLTLVSGANRATCLDFYCQF